jgi:type IV secretory pathway TrbF-like protein
MSIRFVLPIPSTPESAAKRQTADLIASHHVAGNHLRIALVVSWLINLGVGVVAIKAMNTVQNYRPTVIHFDSAGRPEIERADAVYQPREAEAKYFLGQFVTNFYSRMRANVRENYMRSLYFLEPALARAIIDENRKAKMLETFLAGQGDEIDVVINKIALEDLRKAPYRAAVDFEKVYYGPDHQETKRENYTANLVFSTKDPVPNNMILVNPLGFTISYLHEDQAFR